MGLYVKDDDIKVRLQGKVKFTENEAEQNHMHVSLLRTLISEAESEVEFDLSPRYASPLQTREGTPFSKFPLTSNTRVIIKNLCELMACVKVLETDFGRGSSINGDAYAERLRNRYTALLEKVMARKEDASGSGWKYPPLIGLKTNYFNTEADDGFQGMVMTASNSDSDAYPSSTINDPGSSYLNPDFEYTK